MSRPKRGMALAVTIGLVSLVAILAVATMSLAARMTQGSSLGIRDARLDAAASSGLAAALDEWRPQAIARLAIGSSKTFPASIPGVDVSVNVTTTHVAAQVFWIVAEAVAAGGVMRRENLVVRLRLPDAAEMLAADSTDTASLGSMSIDSIAARADVAHPGDVTITPSNGVVHVAGNATLLAGAGSGILIVDGRLSIVGTVAFDGVIVARGGVSVAAPNIVVRGLIRAAGDPPVMGDIAQVRSEAAVQDVLLQCFTPAPVKGRRWSELQ